MCFRIPFLDFFLKKSILDDDNDGSTSPMSLYSHKSHGVSCHYSFCTDERGAIVVDSLPCNDDDDDDGDDVVVDLLHCDGDDDDDDDKDEDGGLVWNKVRPPFYRYRAMLKREKERHLDMEFFDLYLKNRKKEEDRRTRILDSRDDFRDGDLYDPEDRDDNGF